MRFATLANGHPDGRLHLVCRHNAMMVPAEAASTLQQALERWDELAPRLEHQYQQLNEGRAEGMGPFDPDQALAPLPRAWQWLDGSAFDSHGELMERVFKLEARHALGRPLMYQGISDRFLSPAEPSVFPSEQDNIDFEGEFAVITGAVEMSADADTGMNAIRLLVQVNDWSLRYLGPIEMKTGFGMVQCKPRCSMAPIAVTPDELGPSWREGRVALDLRIALNGEPFGHPNGHAMSVGFHELVAHAAYSRDLPAGTVIGSGTVSNPDYREVGSACIAERRAIEIDDSGEARAPFLRFGDEVHMEARQADGSPLFGAISQRVAAR
ncbi:fumarylacetoacetate hydrolase family protein [Halomonas sp. B23F22_10]|uniref:fumarylacetoacetate hydrolase family protein n=1 Tax=Halomonas sp. B23F22_10 TaxID=3459515 RepID=UPI00373DF656